MGVKKRVLILANSVKCGSRCIAGREIVDQNGVESVGCWIRPIGAGKDGGVTLGESKLPDGSQPGVLDVVEIEFEKPEGSREQPENWMMTTGASWRKLDRKFTFESLEGLVEFPMSLWGKGDQSRSDRVSESDVPNRFTLFQSLYLIRPQDLEFSSYYAQSFESGVARKKRRVSFTYQGYRYNFPVTDPQISENRFSPVTQIKTFVGRFVPGARDKWLMVVSLARPFNGYHYKIAATILEKS